MSPKKSTNLQAFLPPMLLEKVDAPFDSNDYIHEPKIDGIRLLLSHTQGVTRLFTRHNNDYTIQYPELLSVPFTEDILVDGEVACVDPNSGAICFESIMERFSAKKTDKIRRLSEKLPANYIIFDILRYKGEDLRGLPLVKRKEILTDIVLPANPHISKIPYFDGAGIALFKQIRSQGWEGTVSKLKNSTYVGHRSSEWLKIINWTYIDIYITGSRKGDFGWLASIPDSNGSMKPVGIIELGVTPKQRKAFYSVKDSLAAAEDDEYVYLRPELKAKVKIRNWTRKGYLRSPAFVEFVL
ncbi:DNA ligase-1 [Paenibacillus sp. yr247]|uniref:ATP-dependent DNA ligase n=1 Tax=Paenibacillus sp. yr247 TaxID=1761880 RepID=UPI0008918E1F|nr:ATP-dependent DNA ligase [Paenibacillus sp. yr247]SDP10236.1 DNA ligase-1 [Paenibacillus sp. yr247]